MRLADAIIERIVGASSARPVSGDVLARELRSTPASIHKTVCLMRKRGVAVESRNGPKGGYWLAAQEASATGADTSGRA